MWFFGNRETNRVRSAHHWAKRTYVSYLNCYCDKLGFNSSIWHIYRTAIDMFTIFITFTTTSHLFQRIAVKFHITHLRHIRFRFFFGQLHTFTNEVAPPPATFLSIASSNSKSVSSAKYASASSLVSSIPSLTKLHRRPPRF